VQVQAGILALLDDLRRERGLSCLFISHDLAVVEMLADRIAVMHNGKLVEVGETAQVVNHPKDPSTQRLLAAVPVPDPAAQQARREARDALLEAQRDELERDELMHAQDAEKIDAHDITDVDNERMTGRGF
jgi:peptide/nickel transport system ATP-binding protein